MPTEFKNYSKKDRTALFLVDDFIQSSRSKMTDIRRKGEDWLKMYNAYIENRDDVKTRRKRARMASAYPFAIVESATSKSKSTILPSNDKEPIIRVIPKDPDSIDQAPTVEKWLNWRFKMSKISRKIELALRHYYIFGFVPLYVRWRLETKNRKIKLPLIYQNPATGEQIKLGMTEPQDITQTLFSGPDFEVGNIWGFFPDPRVNDFERMECYAREFFIPYETLKQRVESNPELFSKSRFREINKDEYNAFSNRFTEKGTTNYWDYQQSETHFSGKGLVKIWRYRSKDKWYEVANERYPIMNIDNPLWDGELDVVVPTRLPQPDQPFGKGMIEPIEKAVAHQNHLRNVRLDTLNLNTRPPWITRKGNVPDKTQLEFMDPTTIIEALDPDALRQVQVQDFSNNAYQEEDRLLQDMAIGSGQIMDSTQIPANIRSAEQQYSLLENIQEKVQMDIGSFVDTGIIPLAEKYLMFGQMFMSEEEILSVEEEFNQQFPIISPEDLIGNFNYKITSSARMIPKQVEATQKLNFMNQIIPILQNPTGFPADIVELMATIAEDLGYPKIFQKLNMALDRLRGQQMLNEFNAIQGNQQDNGQATQAIQGPNGQRGANTANENTPQNLDSILNSITSG